MSWYQNLYIGETVKNRKEKLKRCVDREDRVSGVYLIVTAGGQYNQLEIVTVSEYCRQKKRMGEPLIVGLAGSASEAALLVRQMTEDVYHATGNAKLKEYFTGKG